MEKRKQSHKSSNDTDVCPICNAKVTSSSFEAHFKWEVSRLEEDRKVQEQIEVEAIDQSREKRGAALHARHKLRSQIQALKSTKQTEVISPSLVLKQIRQNRTTRQEIPTKETTTKSKRGKSPSTQPPQFCFLCGRQLYGDSEDINQHIDDCLKTNGSKTSTERTRSSKRRKKEDSEEENLETYSWGGQTRVRTCSLLEGGNGVLNGERTKRDQDEEGDLDITETDDLDKYGQPQYSENDLVRIDDDDEEEQEEGEEEEEEEEEEGTSSQKALHSSTTKSDTESTLLKSSDPKTLLIESLKVKIKEQEKLLSKQCKCLVCLESYDTPVISVNCWHVHCEKCWLSTLGAKKTVSSV